MGDFRHLEGTILGLRTDILTCLFHHSKAYAAENDSVSVHVQSSSPPSIITNQTSAETGNLSHFSVLYLVTFECRLHLFYLLLLQNLLYEYRVVFRVNILS